MDAKRKKFVELSNIRVNKAIKAISLIGNLSNRSNYYYTKDDVVQIIDTLNSEIKSCRKKFESINEQDKPVFELR